MAEHGLAVLDSVAELITAGHGAASLVLLLGPSDSLHWLASCSLSEWSRPYLR